MNSRERKEKRYLRRKQKRLDKITQRSNKYADIDKAFCFHKVMYYSDKCCNGVKWKKSTINFMQHQFTIISNTCHNIKNNNYKVGKTYKFQINERGKTRNIDAPHINDRLIHKVLSNEILLPIYEPHIIYDNGASQKDKGFTFALYRVKDKLQKFYIKNKLNGYVVLIDYSKFFENCSHEIIHNIHKKYIFNDYAIKVIEDYLFVTNGIALGVEIAQREASIIPNLLDHYIENENGLLVRYMDDSVFITDTLENASKLLKIYIEEAKRLGIIVNVKKTKIIKLEKYFKFCKWNYKLFPSGKVILVPHKETIYRQRRKIRKMYKLYLNNKLAYDDLAITKNCFQAYLNIGNSNKYIEYFSLRYNLLLK